LVLITNSLLDFHIRTQNFTGWSGVVAAAIKINGTKLEVQEPTGTILVNNVNVTGSPPATVGGFPFAVLVGPPVVYRLNLTGGQYIEITRTYGNSLQVDALGHGSDFGNSQGLCANWAANSTNALVGRNGVTVFSLTNPQPYGEEWQVNTTLGDPLLFQTNGTAQCRYTQGLCDKQPAGIQECIDRATKAKDACANITAARNTRANCEFDVIQTNDVGVAITVAYKDPLITDPPELCQEILMTNTSNSTTSCSQRGGRCVYRCDKTIYDCIDNLCRGPEPGCSCAFKFNITVPVSPPVTAPVKPPLPVPLPVPVTQPVATTPVTSPVAAPVKQPIPVPVPVTQPVATTPVTSPVAAPVKQPLPVPVPVPVTQPVATTPVTSPVAAPVKQPLSAPVPVTQPVATTPITSPVASPIKLPLPVPVPLTRPITTTPVTPPVVSPVKPTGPVPVPVPVRSILPPSRAPTKKPIKPETRRPTRAPSLRECGLFHLSLFCLNGCGLFGRFIGLC
jgi:hypothetical protein